MNVKLLPTPQQPKPWELAIVLDPETLSDTPRKPGLYVPPNVQGRQKVSCGWLGLQA